MDLHPDFKDLLAELDRAGAEFALVGGYAVGHWAKPRATKDLDVLISGAPDNLARVASALEKFGAPPNVVRAARNMSEEEVVYLGVEPVRIDLLRRIDGVDTHGVLERCVRVEIGGLSLRVIALQDLIANKRASGRPQDLADVAVLERIR